MVSPNSVLILEVEYHVCYNSKHFMFESALEEIFYGAALNNPG